MISAEAHIHHILDCIEDGPAYLDQAHLEQVDAKLKEFDPVLHQETMSQLLWFAMTNYRSEGKTAYAQLARRIVANGLQPDQMNDYKRCAYPKLYQMAAEDPQPREENPGPKGVEEIVALYRDMLFAGHAIQGDPQGAYGAMHYIGMMHFHLPDQAIGLLHYAVAVGFDINKPDHLGETPLLAVISRNDYPGRTGLIRAMLEVGADPMIKTSGGRNCWESAASISQDVFGLLDLLACYTPHARAHGCLGPEEIKALTSMSQETPRGSIPHRLVVWMQNRSMQSETMAPSSVNHSSPRF